MKRLITILLLFNAAYAQLYPLPIVHEPKNYHFQRRVYIDQKLKIGAPLSPTIARKLHVVADTIRFEGLDGTGTFLTIDGSGDVIKGTVGAAGVTGLNANQVLYGSATGTIDQEPEFLYDENDNLLDILDVSGAHLAWVRVNEGETGGFGMLADNRLQINGSSGSLSVYSNKIDFDDTTPKTVTWQVASGGSTHTLTFPNAQGSANTFLKNDGSGNLSWATAVTTEVDGSTTNEVQNLSYDATNHEVDISLSGTSATIPLSVDDGATEGLASFTAADFNVTSGNVTIDYANGQAATSGQDGFLQSADWSTFDKKTGLVQAPIELTAQTASITTSNIAYSTPASDGYYRVTITAAVTTAAATSMDLAIQLRYTEATDNVIKSFPTANVNNYNRTQTNTTGAVVSISAVCHVKASTNIKYYTTWSPVGGSPQYNIHVTVEKLDY